MPDNVAVDNGALTDYIVSSDEAISGQIQRVKLAYSGDGLDTHLTVDADGMLVNLGVNNDVVLGAALPAGTNNIGDVDVATLPVLPAGDNNIGNVDVVSLPALPVGTNNIGDVDVLTLPALVAGTANIGDVDVVSLPELPAGDNNIGNVDIVTLPALASGTNNIGDVDVLTLPALPTGTNNIGDVDVLTLPALPAGTNNIGDVDVLSVVPGSASTSLGKAVGNAAGGTDVGVAALAVRDDALGTLSDPDGDYVPLRVNSDGALHVAAVGGLAGTEYTEGATDASITGTAMLWEDASDTLRAVSAAKPLPVTMYVDASVATHKNATYTSQQTGSDVWTPAAGKKIAVTSVILGTYGVTAGRIVLWFGDNADTVFNQGTDQVLLAASFAPSATAKPGVVFTPAAPVFCTTADRELHVTSDAAISFDLTIEGYEFS